MLCCWLQYCDKGSLEHAIEKRCFVRKDGTPDTVSCQSCHQPVLVCKPCPQGAAQSSRSPLALTAAVVQVNVLRCLLDVASGLEFLHSMKVLHGDLKVGLAVCLLPEYPALQAFCTFWHGCMA